MHLGERCTSCSRRESFVGEFDSLADGRYQCGPCAVKEEETFVARRLARQAEYHRKSNNTHVKHGAKFPCACGEKGRIDFDFNEKSERRAFNDSIIWRTDGFWECSKCAKGN